MQRANGLTIPSKIFIAFCSPGKGTLNEYLRKAASLDVVELNIL